MVGSVFADWLAIYVAIQNQNVVTRKLQGVTHNLMHGQ